ncbi:MAG: cytochrome b [Gammaproteobacteria bacterium]
MKARLRWGWMLAAGIGLPVIAFAADGLGKAAAEFGSRNVAGDNSERLAGHVDSWTALALVVWAVLCAFWINHERAAIRRSGLILAGLACVGICAWFAAVYAAGAITHPRPPLIALDRLKPGLLWAQAIIGAVAALVLLRAGTRAGGHGGDQPALPVRNEARRYGRVSRYLHWTTAILFVCLIPMGTFTSMIPEGAWYRQGYYVVHKTLGLVVLGLVLARVGWHLRVGRPGHDPALRRWEALLAGGVHGLLYFLMLAFPITGFVMSTFGGKLSHFFVWDLPLWWAKDMDAVVPWALAHKIVLPYLALLILGAHVLGAVKHHYFDRNPQMIRRMVG